MRYKLLWFLLILLVLSTVSTDAEMSTLAAYKGNNTAAVHTQNMSQTKTMIKIEDKQSIDTEVKHITEVVGYFAIGSPAK